MRGFEEADVIHVEGELDPIRDLEIIHEELRLKDEEFLTKQLAELKKGIARIGTGGGAGDKAKKEEYVRRIFDCFMEGKGGCGRKL